MRYIALLILALAAALLMATQSKSVDKQAPASAQDLLDLSGCTSCGVEKLTSDELVKLVSIITSRRGISFLDESAHQYMRHEGWLPTEIIGYEKATDGTEETRMIAIREGTLYVLEGPITEKPLMTGLYWSNGIGSSWKILDSDGSSDLYWTRETK